MSKIVFALLGLALLPLCAPAAPRGDFETRVRGYLAAGGRVASDEFGADRLAILRDRRGVDVVARWDAAAIGLPEPSESDLPGLAAAAALVDAQESAQAAAEVAAEAKAASNAAAAAEAAFQAGKSKKLKAYENKVVLFLRSEGAIAADAVSATQDQLNAMYDAWDALPGSQGDAKASKYERLLRPVLRNGGTEAGLRLTP